MKTVCPDYYYGFKCKMDKCAHNCCIGWEIDIDEHSLSKYKKQQGPFGKRFKENIVIDDDGSRFLLCTDGRCAFLNEKGLCEIILGLGENMLCQICSDHPRFRNYYSDRVELGIGLCCEAAGEIILKRNEPMHLVTLEDDGNNEDVWHEDEVFFKQRSAIIDIIQDRSIPLDLRIEKSLDLWDVSYPDMTLEQWSDIYLGLERLDDSWTKELVKLKSTPHLSLPDDKKWEIAFEQLLTYFIFRHLSLALEDGCFEERLIFSVLSMRFIKRLCEIKYYECGIVSLDDLVEYSRQYSSEIEYSDENIDAILNIISRQI